MTINWAIDICDRQKPNGYTREDKIHWLGKLDQMLFDEVISRHEGAPDHFEKYTDDADGETELLADDAYADMYVKWLFAQIDFANAEIQRYNNSIAMYNALYEGWCKSYTRKHMPRQDAYIDARARRGLNATSGPF